VITQKGRAACELNSCDELLGCEILFNNVLEPLNPPEAAAMLAALVFQEKVKVEGECDDYVVYYLYVVEMKTICID
jgi:superfamily II RNA helicase